MSKKLELRSWPVQELSYDEAEIMVKKYNFYHESRNPSAKGINHQYEQIECGVEKLIVDHTTGLTWQQSGNSDRRGYLFLDVYHEAMQYIAKLNNRRLGGFCVSEDLLFPGTFVRAVRSETK